MGRRGSGTKRTWMRINRNLRPLGDTSSQTRSVLARLRTPLAIFQMLTLAALALVIFVSVLLLHHETDDYFTSLPSYLSSIKIVVPPAAIFLFTYAFAFVTGTALTDAPKAALSFARNTFFQSVPWMAFTLAASTLFVCSSAWLLTASTPPAYESLVNDLLGGSSDNFKIVNSTIDTIRANNPRLASHLTTVTQVFSGRSDVNAGRGTVSSPRVQLFIRVLEGDSDSEWATHPLRTYALAEAYSLFGQTVTHASEIVSSTKVQDPNSPFQHAIGLYNRVKLSSSSLVTERMRTSAILNTGNAYYYMGDYVNALSAWRDANSDKNGNPNLNAWSNVVAALVMLDRPTEAIAEGERARAWAEKTGLALTNTYPFAGILEAMGFAKMQTGDFTGALDDFATANAFRNDDLTRQNFALALVLTKRYDDAQKVLRQIAAPVDGTTSRDLNVAKCVYFIWALATPNSALSSRAANFSIFLDEHRSSQELNSIDKDSFAALMQRVARAAQRRTAVRQSCKN
jgi:tetratricopeptide (TPR) repeat protein